MWKTGIIIFIFLVLCFDLSGQNYPPITIEKSNARLGEVFQEITRQTDLQFSYNAKTIDTEQIISFTVRNASLEKTLNVLSQQINIEYTLIEDQIVLNLLADSNNESEKYFTISGFLEDQSSGESLIGATVMVPGTNKGVITNAFGYYALQLKPGKYTVQYSYIGYILKKMELELLKDKNMNLSMSPQSIALPSVIVGLAPQKMLDKNIGQMNLSPNKLGSMPEFGGESGLIKGLQSLPGIKMHSDGSAFFYTRGGERDQNLIIIDDAPIYNPSHLFGFYSIVVPDFAKEIKVYKSDIPTHLGDRLSSIISIRTKDGNQNKLELGGALNPLIYQFSLESPIVKKKSAVFLSFRRSNFNWIYKRPAPNVDLSFGDFSFKWNYKINDNNRVFFTTIASADNFRDVSPDRPGRLGIGWGNLAATFRWNHIFGPKLFSNTTIYTGNYGYRLSFTPNYWQSSLGTLSFKSDFTHYTSPKLKSKFGIETQAFFINPGGFSVDTSIAVLPVIKPNYSRKVVLYYQGQYDLNEKTKLNVGFRMINWSNLGPATYYGFDENGTANDTLNAGAGVYNNYLNVDPRISLQYDLDSTSQVKFSYGIYHQYLQLISNSISPFTSLEIWLPASPNIKPQSAHQFSLNYSKYFNKPKLAFSAAAYYKNFENQIDYKAHANTLLNPFLEGELRFGIMQSYGLEFLLQKDFGRLSGWMGYTFSRAIRQTKALNNGETYPALQDRPHDFSMLLNYEISQRWRLSAYWTIFSGSTFSSPTGFYDFNDQTIPVFDKKNNDRLPVYRRFDLALKFILNKKENARIQHSLTFSIYNALAHKNIVAVNFNKVPSGGQRPYVQANFLNDATLTATQADLVRFFPSLTYKFKI